MTKSRLAGRRIPAEWEPHEATWIGWPHNRTDWPGKIAPIHWVYGEIVRKLAPGEVVRILVQSAAVEARARQVLRAVDVDLSRVEFLRCQTNRGWTRDSGPIFVKDGQGRLTIVHFRFRAWAKYDDWQLDAKIPAFAARKLGYPIVTTDFSLEGGAIDTNGEGTLITTEECLLDDRVQVRNPGLDRAAIEAKLREYLGVRRVIWLGKGIAGDDTHGHVDDLCRFVNRNTVVLCGDPENHERLKGTGLNVVMLPMPDPLYFRGQRLPASYANFYIANAAVLVPTFNDPADRVALGILSELFRDRPVVGIHAVDLVLGLGTLHCLTQQQPA